MKRIACVIWNGTGIGALAFLLLFPFASLHAETLDELADRFRSQKYDVMTPTADTRGLPILHVQKITKSEEVHGVLKQKWQVRDTWKLYYSRSDNELRYQYVEAYREQKAPVLGEWRKLGVILKSVEI